MNTGVGKQIEAAVAETTTKMHGTLKPQAVDNLSTTMNGEAFAYAKYLLYVEHARKNGNKELAELFEKAANTGRSGSDADNLKDAIKGESYELIACT